MSFIVVETQHCHPPSQSLKYVLRAACLRSIATGTTVLDSIACRDYSQWLKYLSSLRVNPDEQPILTAAADVLVVEAGKVAQRLRTRHLDLVRQARTHPRRMRQMRTLPEPPLQISRLRKRTLRRMPARNRIYAGSAPNLSSIMRFQSAITGRAMSVRYACGLCTRSWTVHSARCVVTSLGVA